MGRGEWGYVQEWVGVKGVCTGMGRGEGSMYRNGVG